MNFANSNFPHNSSTLATAPTLLVLGSGYVGSAVAKVFTNVTTTRRSTFELKNRETWKSIELHSADFVLWTFPAASSPEEETMAIEFFDKILYDSKVIIYGSTSAYEVTEQDGWIDETAPLDMSQRRVRTEEILRNKGACILHLAGIFGPGRDPISWYQRGLIQTGLSILNLIHLRDIVSVTQRIFHHEEAFGQRFNVSNGSPKTNLEIVKILKEKNLLPNDYFIPKINKEGSKKVDNSKLRKLLNLSLDDFTQFP